MKVPPFIPAERLRHGDYFDRQSPALPRYRGVAYILDQEQMSMNLFPSIREAAPAYFKQHGITLHRFAAHGLSSQACCMNFLMPLATRPNMLARLVQEAIGGSLPEMLPVEDGPDGRPWFVGFEWIGRSNYLNEWKPNGKPTRGANVTSADAILRFRQHGLNQTLLVEWKYTESYGQPIPPNGNEVRIKRYEALFRAPDSPMRAIPGLEVQDFFWEPFYQLLRQQLLAHRMQVANEDGAQRVRLLHIAPAANSALKKVTAPKLQEFGENAFEVFRGLLKRPEDFISCATEALFEPLLAAPGDAGEWADYLHERYLFLGDSIQHQEIA